MASFHLSVQVVKRSAGRTAVAMAAYRSGQALNDVRAEQVQDYSKRRGVAHAEIIAPDAAPAWMKDRERLWNEVEAGEARKDAQIAREVNLALPAELTRAQRLELVREFVKQEFVSRGMVADVALHDPVPEKGDDLRNFHAHVMLTMRKATSAGFAAKKEREWNSSELLGAWRESWAQLQNLALARAGHKTRVDHRSLRAQRDDAIQRGDRRSAAILDRQAEIHVGPRARAAARKGRRLKSEKRQAGFRQQPGLTSDIYYPTPGFGVRTDWVFNQPLTEKSAWLSKQKKREVKGRFGRTINYPAIDRGNRVDWLTSLMLGNNEQAKRSIVKIDRQMARLRKKLDYWERGFLWKVEGLAKGPAFRRERAIAANEKKRREHAAKRRQQIKELLADLNATLLGLKARREDSLVRKRGIEGWVRRLSRQMDRGIDRDYDGRLR